MKDQKRYGKEELGTSDVIGNHPKAKEGYSLWIENGMWCSAPIVDPSKFGEHAYGNGGYEMGIRDCPCGCFMLSSSSGGPVDPYGKCPKNPIE